MVDSLCSVVLGGNLKVRFVALCGVGRSGDCGLDTKVREVRMEDGKFLRRGLEMGLRL